MKLFFYNLLNYLILWHLREQETAFPVYREFFFPPVKVKFPPVQKDFPWVKVKFPPVQNNFPWVKVKFPPVQNNFPPVQVKLPPVQNKFPLVEVKFPWTLDGL
jgi:hypothetical protein